MVELEQLTRLAAEKEREWRLLERERGSHLEQQLQQKNRQLADLQHQLHELQQDFRFNLELIAQRDQELLRHERGLEEVQDALRLVQQEYGQLRSEAAATQQHLVEERAARDRQAEQHRAALEELKVLRESYVELRAQNAALTQDKVLTERRLEEAQERVKHLDKTRQDEAAALSARQEDLESLEQQLFQARLQARDAEARCEQAQQQAEWQRQQLEARHDVEVTSLTRRLTSNQQALREHEAQMQATARQHQQQTADLAQQLQKARHDAATAQAALLETKLALEDARTTSQQVWIHAHDGHKAEQAELKAENDRLQEAHQAVERVVKQQRDTIGRLETDNCELVAEVQRLCRDIEHLQQANGGLQTALAALNTTWEMRMNHVSSSEASASELTRQLVQAQLAEKQAQEDAARLRQDLQRHRDLLTQLQTEREQLSTELKIYRDNLQNSTTDPNVTPAATDKGPGHAPTQLVQALQRELNQRIATQVQLAERLRLLESPVSPSATKRPTSVRHGADVAAASGPGNVDESGARLEASREQSPLAQRVATLQAALDESHRQLQNYDSTQQSLRAQLQQRDESLQRLETELAVLQDKLRATQHQVDEALHDAQKEQVAAADLAQTLRAKEEQNDDLLQIFIRQAGNCKYLESTLHTLEEAAMAQLTPPTMLAFSEQVRRGIVELMQQLKSDIAQHKTRFQHIKPLEEAERQRVVALRKERSATLERIAELEAALATSRRELHEARLEAASRVSAPVASYSAVGQTHTQAVASTHVTPQARGNQARRNLQIQTQPRRCADPMT
ncbi:uncharacterized protein MONBRDRAFT_24596 [Monosiga brevicollis MX1]|uniref:Uncharacterized protein n=1 Tax=Monosiga brevicollis TaxID=81824 RepID=A9UWX2_MONBE|nr:uncharacterized protein MONBRDRAFT_24596 [Monosiga brevicollis MX1]EDQ90290.1 predicted protein [Monosiga brevicollis MX1]|eukprot:XP_001745057.1 hypothetical protein [Monosiga brevicollis MX1]